MLQVAYQILLMSTCLMVIDQPAFLGLAGAFICQEISGRIEHKLVCMARSLKKFCLYLALLMEEILQEPQSIKIEIMRMNWEELINT